MNERIMVPTSESMRDIAKMSEVEHFSGQKYLDAKPRSITRLFWKFIYIFSRQEKDRLISVDMENAAPQMTCSP
ncbi:hypothetical protein D7I41_19020 [Ochrobactrum sp. MH181795]|nr:hypothetical protein D7I41_19020 [Ochrobactrum sp. MH181795]